MPDDPTAASDAGDDQPPEPVSREEADPPQPDTKPADDAAAKPGDDDTPPTAKLRKEAAKYRTRLRETEAERDQLAERLAAVQRRAVTAAATGPGRLADGDDLWRDGTVDLDDLVADDGSVDADRLDATVTRLLEAHPHWQHVDPPPPARRRPAEALRAGASPSEPHGRSWSEILKP